jgi:hypothetical protein
MRANSWFGLVFSTCALACGAAGGARQGDGDGSVSGQGAGGTARGQDGTGSLVLPIDPSASSASGGSDACIDVSVTFERLIPTVVLLIDQSNTMVIPFEPGAQGRTRWNTVRDVLMDPVTGLVPRLQASVRFGLALFSAKSPVVCPELTQVSIALGNYQAMHDIYAGQEVLDHTPTAESLDAVTHELAAFAEPGPKVVVLATDGNPDNCANLDDNNSPDGGAASKALVIAAAERAFEQGISTYVISVGDEVAEEHLAHLAKAGRGGASDATFYQALQTEALVSAFESILHGVLSCDFRLDGTVQMPDAPRGSVRLDDAELAYGAPDGWDMPAPDTVRLHGASCEKAKVSAERLGIRFPCGTLTPR